MKVRGFIGRLTVLILLALVVAGVASATPQALCIDNVPFDGFLTLQDEFYPVTGNICSSGQVSVNGVPAGSAGDLATHNYTAVVQNWMNPHNVDTAGFDYTVNTYRLLTGEEFNYGPLHFAPGEEPLNLAHYSIQETPTSIRHIVAVKGAGGFDSWGYTAFWKWSERQWYSSADYSWEEWEEPLVFSYVEDITPADDQCLSTARFDGAALMLNTIDGQLGICASSPPSVNGAAASYAGDNPRANYTALVQEGAMTVSTSAVAYTVIYDRAAPGETVWFGDMQVTAVTPVNTLVFTHDGWNYMQATGYGFESSGFTHMHNWADGQLVQGYAWDNSGMGQNYLAKEVSVPTPTPVPTQTPEPGVTPSPTPQPGSTPAPTPTPDPYPTPVQEGWTLFIPLVLKPEIIHRCWETADYPGTPFAVSLPERGIVICSPDGATIDGTPATSANVPMYNFTAPDITDGNHVLVANDLTFNITTRSLPSGQTYSDDTLVINARNGNTVNILRLGPLYGYSQVYVLTGFDYGLEQRDWGDKIEFWSQGSWHQTPKWNQTTILGVKN